MGRGLQKQTKTIEDQGQKQIKAIENNKKQLSNTNGNDYKNELLIWKEREIYKNIYNKKLDEIEVLVNKVNYDDLKYVTESSGIETDFSVKQILQPFLMILKQIK